MWLFLDILYNIPVQKAMPLYIVLTLDIFYIQTLQDFKNKTVLHKEDQVHTTELSWQAHSDNYGFSKAGGTSMYTYLLKMIPLQMDLVAMLLLAWSGLVWSFLAMSVIGSIKKTFSSSDKVRLTKTECCPVLLSSFRKDLGQSALFHRY